MSCCSIQGASGLGKSSFMRAGLLPRLEREDRDFIVLPLIRPGTAALSGRAGLAVALEQSFEKLHRSIPMALGHVLRALLADSDAFPPLLNELLVLATKRLVGDAKPQVDRPPTLVLAIDQAEELFTPDAGQEAPKLRQHLAAALTHAFGTRQNTSAMKNSRQLYGDQRTPASRSSGPRSGSHFSLELVDGTRP
jgi:conflict system STAND superfamily ATPase